MKYKYGQILMRLFWEMHTSCVTIMLVQIAYGYSLAMAHCMVLIASEVNNGQGNVLLTAELNVNSQAAVLLCCSDYQ